MIKILMIGINHYDPFGRGKVHEILRKEKSFSPDCVAVEWGKEAAETLISQRRDFYMLARATYPHSAAHDLQLLSDAIAFEADAHQAIYPQLPIVWLDEKRKVPSDVMETYLEDRLSVYSQYGPQEGRLIASDVANYAHRLANSVRRESGERDKVFYREVMDAVSRGHKSIICVVGATHASLDLKGSFASRLRDAGCEVRAYDTTQDTQFMKDE